MNRCICINLMYLEPVLEGTHQDHGVPARGAAQDTPTIPACAWERCPNTNLNAQTQMWSCSGKPEALPFPQRGQGPSWKIWRGLMVSDRQNCSSCPNRQSQSADWRTCIGYPAWISSGNTSSFLISIGYWSCLMGGSTIKYSSVGPVGTQQRRLVEETPLHLLRDDPKTPRGTHLQLNLIQLCGTGLIIGKVWGETPNVMQFY